MCNLSIVTGWLAGISRLIKVALPIYLHFFSGTISMQSDNIAMICK